MILLSAKERAEHWSQLPQEIKPLTSLRFIAAAWLLAYFLNNRFVNMGGQTQQFLSTGYLGVDLFFILSGFILAHVYGASVLAGNFSYKNFVWARLARIYPTHLLMLFVMIGLYLAAKLLGQPLEPAAFNLSQLPAHFTMTHAWGFLKSDGWNFPSWSISAEWFAYLGFPFFFALATIKYSRGTTAAWFAVLAVLAGFAFLYLNFNKGGHELTDMTWGGGNIRIVPSFLAGIALRRLAGLVRFTGNESVAMAALAVVMIIAVSIVPIPRSDLGLLTWPSLCLLVFALGQLGLKETENHPIAKFMGAPNFLILGQISFAIYMVHLPVDIIYFTVMEKLFGTITPETLIWHLAAVFALACVAGGLVHFLWEDPCRLFLRDKPAFFLDPKKAKEAPVAEAGIIQQVNAANADRPNNSPNSNSVAKA